MITLPTGPTLSGMSTVELSGIGVERFPVLKFWVIDGSAFTVRLALASLSTWATSQSEVVTFALSVLVPGSPALTLTVRSTVVPARTVPSEQPTKPSISLHELPPSTLCIA